MIFHITSAAPLVALDGRHGAVTAFLAILVGGVGGLFASVIATGAVAVILSELVKGRWWRTFGFTALVDTLAVLSGPLLGVGLLLLTDHSLNFINLAAALVYTFTVPYAVIQLTLYYFDPEARGPAENKGSASPADRSAQSSGTLSPAE